MDQENCDPNNGRFERDFSKVAPIKEDRNSKVFRVRHKMDRQVYAVQVATPGISEVLLREVEALSSLWVEGAGSASLLRYFSAWMEDGRLHVQTEPYECSLRDRIVNVPHRHEQRSEEELVKLLRDMVAALATLHDQGIAHTDIRPENILTTERGCFKLAGLGHCRRCSDEDSAEAVMSDAVQNRSYHAPEDTSRDVAAAQRGDIFTLALVACELVASRPLNGNDWQQLRSGQFGDSLMPPLSEPLLALLHDMLCQSPGKRPTCAEVSHCLENLQSRSLKEESLECRRAELLEAIRKAEEDAQEQRRRVESIQCKLAASRKHHQITGSKLGESDRPFSFRCDKQLEGRAVKRASSYHLD
jgi:serine/threonine protein kinase